jgi:RNA polymerase sigma-70 factor (ECF subfamily)
MLSDKEIIDGCLRNEPYFQKILYDKYAKKMYGICLRFAKNRYEADDILQEAFVKIFKNLSRFTHSGSFEGWIRRTFVNTSINYYKKHSKYNQTQNIDEQWDLSSNLENPVQKISAEDLLTLINELPDGYRMVFNLFIIEGYSHGEISEMMGISEGTSKSQLARARKTLQRKIEELYK